MRNHSSTRIRRAVVMIGALTLVAASCGSDSESASTNAPATTAAPDTADTASGDTAAPADTASGDTAAPADTASGDTAAPPTDGEAGSAGCPTIDSSIDPEEGNGAGRFISDLACADAKPLKAEGDPIVIGFQNLEGDPNGSFPEFSLAAQAAADYINNELGGLGADIQNGIPGRPIDFKLCKSVVSPDDSQRCANELVTEEPFMVFSSINFFGNQFPIYAAAKTPVVVITPITVGDFTSPGVYSIGGGGGCLGVHTGLVEFATNDLKGKRIAVPWADTPPGVVCYYDLENKPLDVLQGVVAGTSEKAGSIPDLQHMGVPIKPATPDVSPAATEVLDFDPDVIMFSAQGADCWNLVDGLGRLGWTPDQIPLVLSGACIDFDAMKAAGDLAKGVYFVGSSGAVLNDPSTITNVRDKFEAGNYQTKPVEYGLPADQLQKGFATQGWTGMLSLWELSSQIIVDGGELTQDAISAAYANTDNQHLFGSTPMSCSTAPAPYVAVCNAEVSATQWDGTQLQPVRERFSAIDLVAGTELKPGP